MGMGRDQMRFNPCQFNVVVRMMPTSGCHQMCPDRTWQMFSGWTSAKLGHFWENIINVFTLTANNGSAINDCAASEEWKPGRKLPLPLTCKPITIIKWPNNEWITKFSPMSHHPMASWSTWHSVGRIVCPSTNPWHHHWLQPVLG